MLTKRDSSLFSRFLLCLWGLIGGLLLLLATGCGGSGTYGSTGFPDRILPRYEFRSSVNSPKPIAILTSDHAELSAIVEQTCKAAGLEGTDRRFVGQHSRTRTIVLGTSNPQFETQVRKLLGIEKVPEPPPSEHPPEPVNLSEMGDSLVDFGKGAVAEVPLAFVPGGSIGADLAIEAKLLPRGTKAARIGRSVTGLVVGVGQIVVGCGGTIGGIGLSGTGGGAIVGAPVTVGSLTLLGMGTANAGNGIRQLTIEILRRDDGPGSSSGPPQQTSQPAAKPPQQTPPPAAKPPQAPPVAPTQTTTTTWAKLKPYKDGGGHHVPAKRAFEGTPGYDAQKALAIPDDALKAAGVKKHNDITRAQQRLYREHAATSQPLTWEVMAKIETDALVEAGMKPELAHGTVAKAIQVLKDAGIAGPLRTPWGGGK